eukprot:1015328-Pleurochrysis_carterae.AAC.1
MGLAKEKCIVGGAPAPLTPHCSGVYLGVTGVRLALDQWRDARSVHRATSDVWLLGGYPSNPPPPTRGPHPDRAVASHCHTQLPPLLCRYHRETVDGSGNR